MGRSLLLCSQANFASLCGAIVVLVGTFGIVRYRQESAEGRQDALKEGIIVEYLCNYFPCVIP